MNSNLHIYDNNNNDNNVDNNYNIIIILQAHSIVISDVDEVAREETRLVKQSFDRISNPKPSQKRSQNFSAIKSCMDNYFDELNEREALLSDTQIAERYKVCINEAIALGVKPPIHSDEDLRLDARVHRYHIACLESQRKIMGRNIYIFSLLFYSFLFFFILFFTLSFFYILPSL